jgi:hypothetical protein
VIPLQERFFNGGENTVRSFKEKELGPKDSSTGEPVGGEAFNVFSIELRQRLKRALEGALFYDVGNVESQARGRVRLPRPRARDRRRSCATCCRSDPFAIRRRLEYPTPIRARTRGSHIFPWARASERRGRADIKRSRRARTTSRTHAFPSQHRLVRRRHVPGAARRRLAGASTRACARSRKRHPWRSSGAGRDLTIARSTGLRFTNVRALAAPACVKLRSYPSRPEAGDGAGVSWCCGPTRMRSLRP